MSYQDFLATKHIKSSPSGFSVVKNELNPKLYEFQNDLVRWGLKRGKGALFTMTGTGKTLMQAVWADSVSKYDGNGSVLILAPLAVSKQTAKQMGEKFGIDIRPCRDGNDIGPGINITNYEMLHHFEPHKLAGIVLDESSIIKAFNGKTRTQIIEFSRNIPFRLACTATPAPNDYMELGNTAEFLGVMSYTEMLATFFVHDGGDTAKWRLKGHAQESFWKWLASWGVFLTKPSDLGYSDDGFDLPALNTYQHIVESGATEGSLFAFEARGLQERQAARRESLPRRCEKAAEIATSSETPFMLWCDLNAESELLTKIIPDAVEVTGSDKPEYKEEMMMAFAEGQIKHMISKGSICGFGMNWQVCSNTAFVGLSDSFETVFQCTKRFHRHGQTKEVNRHIIVSEAEGSVLSNIKRKESEFMAMIGNMVEHTKNINIENIKSLTSEKIVYNPQNKIQFPAWLKEGGY